MNPNAEHSQNLNLPLQSEFRELFNAFVPMFYSEINCSQHSHLSVVEISDSLRECKMSQLLVSAKFPTLKLKTCHQHSESTAEKILYLKLKKVSRVPYQWVQKSLPRVLNYSSKEGALIH